MRGWGIRIQFGRTEYGVKFWPFHWYWQTSLMDPKLYGFGAWLTKSAWND